MTTERWQQIESVFQTALDLTEGEERERYLAETCAGDADLRREVEKLIVQHERAGSFISVAAIESGELPEMTDPGVDSMVNRRIGSYRLLKEIGRGGMGAVYEAERADNSFQRRVAVKFIKRGMDTDLILKRFRNERQILASLNHPNIARLLDGGTTADGLPYFVMEFIEGEPLYQYCDRRKLSISERLNLFRQVCEAVEEAHRNKVVHRDLKPSNILVKSEGAAKLLDFGIAKLLDPDLAGATIEPTATQMRIMTPEYASPEQVCGEPVSPASDIYALGVLLYELVAGHRPYRFKNRAMHEITRVICEQEPIPPSESLAREDNLVAALSGAKITLDDVFQARGAAEAEDLSREIAGSLDLVILKALRKTPAERYQTATDLLADINRYLNKRPVKAESFAAKTPAIAVEKTVTRAAKQPDRKSIAILPLRVIGAGATGDQSEEFLGIGLADALIRRLSTLHKFIVRPTSSVFHLGSETTNPFAAGETLGVDYVLDGNVRRVGNRIRVTAQFLNVFEGSTEWAESFDEDFTDVLSLEDVLSERVAASLVPHLNKGERRRLAKRGTENAAAYEAYLKGRFYWSTFTLEGFSKAIKFYQQAIELAPDYSLAYAGIADYYNFLGIYGVMPFAETSARAWEAAEKAVALDDTLAEGHAALGFAILMRDFDFEQTEKHLKYAVELNPNYALGRSWYCYFLGFSQRFDEAFEQIGHAMEVDPFTPIVPQTLCWNLYHARRYEESIESCRKLLEKEPNYGLSHVFLSLPLVCVGRYDEAVKSAEKGIDLLGKSPYSLLWLASSHAAAGNREKAEQLLGEIDEMAAAGRYVSPYMRAMVFCNLGEIEAALSLLEKALEIRDGRLNWLGVDPQFDRLRGKERFQKVLRGANNPSAKQVAEFKSAPERKTETKSIAVLPLKMIGAQATGDSGEEFLGFGLADALTTRLSGAKKLTVRPTASVSKFDAETIEPFQAGRELGVDFILDGNIRRAGERLRVTVQLLDVANNSTRWAQSFDEKSSDVLELEDSISEKVANLLVPQITGEEQKRLAKRGTNNPEAYEAYLRGRFHWNQFTPESLPKALAAFETAVRLDPEYALAYVGIADFYIWANIYGIVPSLAGLAQAEKAALRAIELDDELAEAYASLGLIKQNRREWTESEAHALRSIELSPNYVHGREWYAAFLVGTGRIEQGIEEIKLAERLDPLSLRTKTLVSWTLYQCRRYDEALKRAEQIIELDKYFPQGYLQKGVVLLAKGQTAEALENIRRFDELTPDSPLAKWQLCQALVAAGHREQASEVLRELKSVAAGRYVKSYFLAGACVALGEIDEAFEYFERAADEDDAWLLWIPTETQFDSVRNDARMAKLMRRLGNGFNIAQAEKIEGALAQKKGKTSERNGAKSIAVLPLKILGGQVTGETGDEFLSIGLADVLTTRLSNCREIIVRPTMSVLKASGNADETDAFAVGRELGVDYVLAGNLRRAGERIRVTAQLLDVAGNSTEWAQIFDEKFSDALALEDSVSAKVVESLLPHLSGEEKKRLAKRGTDNPTAYEAFVRGRFYWNLNSEEGFAKAINFYQRATEADPDFAPAYAAIAEYYIFLGIHCVIPFASAAEAAKNAAQTAVRLDPQLAEAHAALGFTTITFDLDWKNAEELFRRAISLNPNSVTANFWFGAFLAQRRRFDEALEQVRRICRIDPDSLIGLHMEAWVSYHARRFEDSISVHQKMLGGDPNYAWGWQTYSWVLRRVGRFDEAIRAAEKARALVGDNGFYLCNLAAANAAAGRRSEAEKILEQLREIGQTGFISDYMLALVYCALGEKDQAFASLEKSLAARDGWLNWLDVEPQLDVLRDDGRFADLLRRAGIIEATVEKKAEEIKTASSSSTAGARSIAVLPLKAIGKPNADDEFLGIGLADAMISRLSKVGRLLVRPTSSVLHFEQTDAFEIGKVLAVDYVLDGTIRRAGGERIRITAQLLDVRQKATVWAESFDERLSDVLELEDLVAEKVARLLIKRLTGEEKKNLARRGTDNAAAYEAYLRGRYHFNLFTPADLKRAITFFERAIELDPDFAAAYSEVAGCYHYLSSFGGLPPVEANRISEEMARRALELDPTLGEALGILGFISFAQNHDLAESIGILQRAIALNSAYSFPRVSYSVLLTAQGKFDEALEQARRVVELNPIAPFEQQHYGWILYHARRFDEALSKTRMLLETEPNFSHSHGVYSWILRQQNRLDESLAHALRSIENNAANPWLFFNLAATYAALNRRTDALAAIERAKKVGNFGSPFVEAIAHFNLNDLDKTFDALERAYRTKDVWLVWLATEPQLDRLRGDIRFQDLMRRVFPTEK